MPRKASSFKGELQLSLLVKAALLRCSVAKPLAWSVVELLSDAITFVLRPEDADVVSANNTESALSVNEITS